MRHGILEPLLPLRTLAAVVAAPGRRSALARGEAGACQYRRQRLGVQRLDLRLRRSQVFSISPPVGAAIGRNSRRLSDTSRPTS